MKKILSEKIPRIIRNKKKLEKTLEVKISNRGKEVYLEGNAENEYLAEKVIDAINLGFEIEDALSIKKEEKDFEIMNIKDYTKNKKLERIKSRLIGKEGKVLSTLRNLSEAHIQVHENQVGIISDPEILETLTQAIIQIIQGAKQSHAYAFLEKNRPAPIYDLGLKEDKNL
ncbi:MAG: hypothetical protein KC516_02745 [Nanoarchaeota archaeon]|nr:hypothetical protein [Nanoarchaeota archaeon]